MMKKMFLDRLRVRLSHLSKEEQDERIAFYSEMIDDRIEDGLTEEEAVKAITSVDEITKEVIIDFEGMNSKNTIKEKVTALVKDKKNTGNILLIVLGFPVWFPLLVLLFALALSLYVVGCAVIISLWAVVVALGASFIGGTILGIIYLFQGASAMLLGLSIACGGLAIFSFFGLKELTKLYCVFTKKIISWIRREK
jgi:uncharacterized membrane protein